MAKLVITSNGMIAHGLNQLAQEVVDVGGCPGLLPEPVASTLLLPTDWNGLGAPADKTMGIVDQGSGAGVYLYQRNVDGELFDSWLHSWAALRGVTYWRDTVEAAALRVSVRIGGDTAAAIGVSARNWTIITNTGGSVVDVGAGPTAAIRITGGSGGGVASFIFFQNIDVSTPGPMLVVAKASFPGPGSGFNPNNGGYVNMQDGTRLWRASWSYGGAPNEFRFSLSGSQQMGAGFANLSPFERIDMIGQMGYLYPVGPVGVPSGKLSAQSFDQGYVPGASDVDANLPQSQAIGGAGNFLFASESGDLPSTFVDLQELHALRVL